MRFDQKKVVIASSGGSIGGEIARKMTEEGAKTVLLTCDAAAPAELDGITICPVADFADEAEMKALSEKVLEDLGGVDVVVTAIFDKAPEGAWNEVSAEDAHKTVRNILTGAETVLKFFVQPLVDQESGHVVLVMSVAGRRNVPGVSWPQALAYAGLGGIIRNGATVFGKNSVTFNGVAVGPVEGMDFDAYIDENVKGVWGRKATGEDVANAVMYLSDDLSAWNTGEIVDLNGGFFAI
ncbi:MAG: SDR family oxidoreductase [Lachnospiraceae bacterium]|nr:SDR family oxidoreductase [Lachnospiraceae bacterium]